MENTTAECRGSYASMYSHMTARTSFIPWSEAVDLLFCACADPTISQMQVATTKPNFNLFPITGFLLTSRNFLQVKLLSNRSSATDFSNRDSLQGRRRSSASVFSTINSSLTVFAWIFFIIALSTIHPKPNSSKKMISFRCIPTSSMRKRTDQNFPAPHSAGSRLTTALQYLYRRQGVRTLA